MITSYRRWFMGTLLGLSAISAGCGGSGISIHNDGLVVATSWPESERRAIAAEFGNWLRTAPGRPRQDGSSFANDAEARIVWVPIASADDPSQVVRQRWPRVDVLLGGPASTYENLAREGRLIPTDRDRRCWRVVRRSAIGRVWNPRVAGVSLDEAEAPRLTFDDPKRDPLSLAWAKAQLGVGGWASGYARLVWDAGYPRRIGRQGGSALAAVERGEAAAAPTIAENLRTDPVPLVFVPGLDASAWLEGVALIRGGRHRGLADRFLDFLAARIPADSAGSPPDVDLEVDSLLADLLGSTLVDAQDELWEAWRVLERAGRPARAMRWMTEPPPWPPASIERILGGKDAMPLLETLTREMAPEADVRTWLLAAWLGPRRLVDEAVLRDLAEGAGGRVVREPRFRAWLRAEWTAWACQRYRRVARLAERAVSES